MIETTQPILSVKDLKTYFVMDEGTVKAVDGVSLDIHPGKTLGIVGESGCGKSVTALSILRIVERPGRLISGEILLYPDGSNGSGPLDLARLGANSRQMRDIRGKEIALIFQEPMTSFSPLHTVGHQITEVIRLHLGLNKAEARERALELLRLVGIPRAERRIDEYVFQLSGGLRQRAMIAMALSCNPRLLIADEPTTALDVTVQAQILDLLTSLQAERQMGLMLITHNMGVIAEMADDVLVMYLGRVVEQGPVSQIFRDPKHPYTRALLRSIPGSQLARKSRMPTITGSIPHPHSRPAGCPFHPRCPSAIAGVCELNEPSVQRVAENQAVSCFLYA